MVYLAEDSKGARVAIKLIRSELADDPDFRARFRREVDAGRRVGGLCNARYLDADLDGPRPYLVTQYVEGGDLADFVAEHGPMPEERLIGLAVGLAEALVAMHAAGVIHRDLKPSNVLLAPDGPKVVDFGISQAIDGTALTLSGVVIGSPSWMAPEQALGHPTTAAVDVFSWGGVIAFAATGRPPFGEGTPAAVLYRVVHEEPDLQGLPTSLRPVVTAALAKDHLVRPASDRLLINVVQQAMAAVSIPGGSVAQTTVVLDRTWRQPDAATRSLPTAGTTRRNRRWTVLAVAVVAVLAAAAIAYATTGGFSNAASRGHHQPKTPTSTTSGPSTSTTSTSSSTTTSTSTPTSTTAPAQSLQAILAPATTAPVGNECTLQLIYDADGNVSPLLCPGGGVNVLAWQHYAEGAVGNGPERPSMVMELGPYASPPQVYQAMCSDYADIYGTNPLTISAEELAAAYYGWTFAGDDPVMDFEQGCPGG